MTAPTPFSAELTVAEEMKFRLLAEGLEIDPAARAHLDAANDGRALTPADYASTSGLIIKLADNVWVNAPIAAHNPNFVTDPGYTLRLAEGALVVEGYGQESEAHVWLPPAYHDLVNTAGEAYTSYAFTHADRVRIAPVEGCAMTCKFCDLPYEFRYRTKRIEGLVDAVRTAATDPVQPASHVLISGGTPRGEDVDYVRAVYEAVLGGFPDLAVDIMMVPLDRLLDVRWLARLGVNELSVNIEIHNREIARRYMRRKHDQGLDTYLDYLADAAEVLGRGRVRSMLMVGLEPIEDTLAGVAAIAERGCVPVLSPFRPDGSTPLASLPPPTAAFMQEVYLRSREITAALGLPLGPSCIPCSHNTLTLAGGAGDAFLHHGHPRVV